MSTGASLAPQTEADSIRMAQLVFAVQATSLDLLFECLRRNEWRLLDRLKGNDDTMPTG